MFEGRGGDDFLWGGKDVDFFIGGDGNDVYNMDDVGDRVVEVVDGGIDFVLFLVSYVFFDNVENFGFGGFGCIVFESFENINGIGNVLDNELGGNVGNNYLMGFVGNDVFVGG